MGDERGIRHRVDWSAVREIFLVAHPEASHVTDQLIGGWYDSTLTEKGLHDAALIGEHLRRTLPQARPRLIVSSDLFRTRMTAELISERIHAEVELDSNLRERSYGEAEGKRAGTVPALEPPPRSGDRMSHRPSVEGTETRQEWALRVYLAMEQIIGRKISQTIIVTHGGSITYLIAAWIGLPLEHAGYAKFASSPGGITHLREDPVTYDRQVVALNALDHLG